MEIDCGGDPEMISGCGHGQNRSAKKQMAAYEPTEGG